jgi:hypothetical protein
VARVRGPGEKAGFVADHRSLLDVAAVVRDVVGRVLVVARPRPHQVTNGRLVGPRLEQVYDGLRRRPAVVELLRLERPLVGIGRNHADERHAALGEHVHEAPTDADVAATRLELAVAHQRDVGVVEPPRTRLPRGQAVVAEEGRSAVRPDVAPPSVRVLGVRPAGVPRLRQPPPDGHVPVDLRHHRIEPRLDRRPFLIGPPVAATLRDGHAAPLTVWGESRVCPERRRNEGESAGELGDAPPVSL